MQLGQAREEFCECLMRLEAEMLAKGRKFRRGECMRTDEQAVINALGPTRRHALALLVANVEPALATALTNNGKVKSPLMTVHRFGLAQDYDLFKDGQYQDKTEQHKVFGEFWEKLHPLARWGGRFGDGNHYSFEWYGVK